MDEILRFFESKEFQTWWWLAIPVAVLCYVIWDWLRGKKSGRRKSQSKEMEYQDAWDYEGTKQGRREHTPRMEDSSADGDPD
jgi:hypothetical protein